MNGRATIAAAANTATFSPTLNSPPPSGPSMNSGISGSSVPMYMKNASALSVTTTNGRVMRRSVGATYARRSRSRLGHLARGHHGSHPAPADVRADRAASAGARSHIVPPRPPVADFVSMRLDGCRQFSRSRPIDRGTISAPVRSRRSEAELLEFGRCVPSDPSRPGSATCVTSHPALACQISIHHGVVRRSDVDRRRSLPRHRSVDSSRAGLLIPLHQGDVPSGHRTRLVRSAMCRCMPRRPCGVDHRSRRRPTLGIPPRALRWTFPRCSSPTTATRCRAVSRCAARIELHREDVVQRPDGIRVASPPRAWFDCAVHLDDRRFEMLTEHVLDNHCRAPTLWRTVRRLEARGRRGLARVRRVLSARSVVAEAG